MNEENMENTEQTKETEEIAFTEPMEHEALTGKLDALSAALGGSAKLVWGTYKGDGKLGVDHIRSVEVPFTPALVVVAGANKVALSIRKAAALYHLDYKNAIIVWDEHSVGWYGTTSAELGMNGADWTYQYVVAGY